MDALLADTVAAVDAARCPAQPARPGSEVLWLHNTELPDPSPYIRPTELVLTNGLVA